MLVKVFEDLLTPSLLVILNLNVPLLKLLVLRAVLTSYLLILLSDNVRLRPPVLVLQCLLIIQLLLHLSLNCCRTYFSQEWNQCLIKEVVESISSLLE